MAKDIKLLIGGSISQAEKALRELQRTGGEVAHRLERDFAQLGTSSSLAFDQKRQAASSAYERIKQSGIATGDELKRAEKALGSELAKIDEDQYGKRLSLAEKFRANWVKIAAVAGAIAGAGVAAYSLGSKAVAEAAEFETALVDMGKVTGESLESIRAKIMALPPELGSATELMRGYYQVISAGVTDPNKAMELLVTASKAAKSAHVDQSEVIKGLTKVMAGFSGEIKTAAEASDLLFAIEKVGQTSFAELVPIIGDIASLSKQAAVSQFEMGAMMSQLTQTAGSTSQAATQYRAILMGLIKPTKDMGEALGAMGFQSGQAAIESKGLAGTLQGLEQYAKASGIGMGKLFESSEALVGLGPQLSGQFQGYTSALKEMESSAGGTDRAFSAWSGTFEAVKAAFDNSLGKALITLGRELTPEVIKAMQGVTTWINENQGTIVEFAKTIGSTVAWVGEQIASLMSQMNTTRQWYEAYKSDQIGFFDWAFTGNDAAAQQLSSMRAGQMQSSHSAMDFSQPLFPGYAVGTRYVPATGLYQLHRGEEVRTRGEAAGSQQGGQSITIQGGINITLPGVTRADQSSARELARAIWPELQAFQMRTRTA